MQMLLVHLRQFSLILHPWLILSVLQYISEFFPQKKSPETPATTDTF